MNTLHATLFFTCLILSTPLILLAQNPAAQPPVTNDEIIEMVKAGLTSELIITKIKSSRCNFDTSPFALVSLKESNVPDSVLLEMVRNPEGGEPAVERIQPVSQLKAEATPTERPQAPSDGLPEYGHISEIRRMRRAYVVADDIDSQNLLVKALSSYEGLQIVGSPDRAELFITFGQNSAATSMKLWGYGAGTIDRRTKAQFIVSYRSESGRPRIVWQETEDIQTSSGWTFSRPNEVNVSRHFIKELRKVRGEN